MMKNPLFSKNKLTNLHYEDKTASYKIGEHLLSLLPSEKERPIVVVCIGTDRSTGDSLGPLVGMLLEEKRLRNFSVYGTIHNPVHALNLEETINSIYNKYNNPFIISIDACLGRSANIGNLQVNEGPLKPGAAVNKQLPSIGEVHIIGIVNVSGFMEVQVLQNTRLSHVMKMAKKIANGVYYANYYYNEKRIAELSGLRY